MYTIQKKKCHLGNLKIASSDLIFQSFGNLSLRIDKDLFVIKPSGANLKKIKYQDYPIISIGTKENKNKLNPSVDTDFHLEIYKNFKQVNCIVHTHSKYATIWAQACKSIPNLGTTHSDYWLGKVPVTNILSKKQIHSNYEKNIGKNIVKLLNKTFCYGVLIANHGPITFAETLEDAILYSERLEYVSEIAYKTIMLNKNTRISKDLVNKHYFRKHGKESYYGQ